MSVNSYRGLVSQFSLSQSFFIPAPKNLMQQDNTCFVLKSHQTWLCALDSNPRAIAKSIRYISLLLRRTGNLLGMFWSMSTKENRIPGIIPRLQMGCVWNQDTEMCGVRSVNYTLIFSATNRYHVQEFHMLSNACMEFPHVQFQIQKGCVCIADLPPPSNEWAGPSSYGGLLLHACITASTLAANTQQMPGHRVPISQVSCMA